MSSSKWTWGVAAATVLVVVWAAAAGAGEHVTQPQDWQISFQPAAAPVMERISEFNNLVLVIILAILAFVLALMGYVLWRFRAKRNPVPSKVVHNTAVEIVWTVLPIMILVVIAIPSFKLLYFMDRAQDAEMTIKAIGHQWYWTYEYPDHGNFAFDAVMLEEDELQPGQVRLLETDARVVLPVDTTIRILTTADDVIHAFAVPAFGIKIDAVPGRLNETWVKIEREGVYYGQCSELCGVRHGFMPITVEAVSKDAFAAWAEKARQEFARDDGAGAPAEVALAVPRGAD